MKYKILILVLFLGITANGCGTIQKKMLNTSPLPTIPSTIAIGPIPATVSVNSDNTDFVNDLSIALKKHAVFKKVVPKGKSGDLELFATSTTQADHHTGAGLAKAALSGLTFGMASMGQMDPFDFSVTVKAQLKRKNKVIAKYETTGSYHSEISEFAPVSTKLEQVKSAVLLSYDHALSLLASKIKQDRKKIQKHLER